MCVDMCLERERERIYRQSLSVAVCTYIEMRQDNFYSQHFLF
jgi:hypothetical protein